MKELSYFAFFVTTTPIKMLKQLFINRFQNALLNSYDTLYALLYIYILLFVKTVLYKFLKTILINKTDSHLPVFNHILYTHIIHWLTLIWQPIIAKL